MTEGAESGLTVLPGLTIPRSELEYRATRAGGAGGQHVNTSSTRIELLWNVRASRVLTEDQRERIAAKLAARITTDGDVRVVASERRSQQQNRKAADERLATLVRGALAVRRKRKPTRPGKAAIERRLTEKKRNSERKRRRSGPAED